MDEGRKIEPQFKEGLHNLSKLDRTRLANLQKENRKNEEAFLRDTLELQDDEVIEWHGVLMRVVGARSEDREYGRVRIVRLERLSER